MYRLILASQSPRRRDLLQEAGYKFTLDHVKVSENIGENLNLRTQVEVLAKRKNEAYRQAHKHLDLQNFLALSADTLVGFNERILGKPQSPREAEETLQKLSGNTHSVMTAFCLYNFLTGEEVCEYDHSKVEFRKISAQEIKEYVESGDPLDKAGSYGVQGPARKFVSSIQGSFSNVMGLPMERLTAVLKEKNWIING